MRIFRVAALLSLCVLVGCSVWYHDVTSGNGPDRSVDLRPLAPILTAMGALALIWIAAGIAWVLVVATRQREADRDEV